MAFYLTSTTADDEAVITLVGEVDVYTAPQVRDELQALIERGARRVVVDMAGTAFIDSTGLGVLVTALKRLAAHGGSLVVRKPDHQARSAIRVTGLDAVFDIED